MVSRARGQSRIFKCLVKYFFHTRYIIFFLSPRGRSAELWPVTRAGGWWPVLLSNELTQRDRNRKQKGRELPRTLASEERRTRGKLHFLAWRGDICPVALSSSPILLIYGVKKWNIYCGRGETVEFKHYFLTLRRWRREELLDCNYCLMAEDKKSN